MENKIAFITGATAGIGQAIAELLAEKNYALVLCGRRQERLDKLEETLGKKTEVTTLCFDVRDRTAVKAAITSLPANWAKVDLLINNAGNAHGLQPFHEGNLDDWEAMIDINVKGLLYVSKYIIPQMVERKTGQVINIGSIAGKEVYPNGNVYCASKFSVDAITQGMRLDLNPYGIKVTAINPGLVETEFSLVRFKGDQARAAQVYKGYTPLYAQDVAETVWFAASRPSHVQIADLVVLPTAQASSTMVHKTD
ncbi:MAG: SDR family NAD(P)-dependent oxidoreductase [Thermonemataceae bacterium]